MRKIWERDRLYAFLRHYVDACTRASYTQLRVEGTPPAEEAVLIAPNHCNTLMDALVVLQSRTLPTVFGARADIFSQPAVARILRFLKILPMVRRRDGIRNVLRNYETMDEVQEVLGSHTPFCMFPEGRHTPGRELQPLQKGIARMAFQSAAVRPTKVIPAGISYSDFFHYRGSCLLRYGEPIDVNAFLAAHAQEPEAARYQAFLTLLSGRISALIEAEALPAPCPWWRMALVIPLLLPSALLSLPLWLPAEWLCAHKVKDRAFHNTVRYGFRLAGMPLLMLLWGLVFFLTLPAAPALALCVLAFFSYSIFYDGMNLLRRR